jgi:hypothetical protein
MHEKFKKKLQQSNTRYKQEAYLQRRQNIFEEEMVMTHVRQKMIPHGYT